MYAYDIFFSYKRDPAADAWHERVCELIRFWASKQLPQPECRAFFDQRDMPLGLEWRRELGDILRSSKCLVCLWSVDYVFSVPCLSEFRSFRAREDALGLRPGRLLAPALFYDSEDRLLSEMRALQYADFSEYSATFSAFWRTGKARRFEDMIKSRFSVAVAEKIVHAPPYEDTFPVILVAEESIHPRPRHQRPAETL